MNFSLATFIFFKNTKNKTRRTIKTEPSRSFVWHVRDGRTEFHLSIRLEKKTKIILKVAVTLSKYWL